MFGAIVANVIISGRRRCAFRAGVMMRVAAIVLLTAPVCADAQDTSGWTKFGDALFGFDREGVEWQAQQQRAEADWARAETQRLYQEAQLRRSEEAAKQQTVQIRIGLSVLWQKAGFSEADANAFAAAYEPSESDAAVISGVRSKGSKSAILATKGALDSFNYKLANQLLIAFFIVGNEEQSTVAPASIIESKPNSAP